MALVPQTQPPSKQLSAKWLLALGGLWFILVAMAEIDATSELAVALAWLVAVGAVLTAVNPNGANILGRMGVIKGESQ